MRTGHVKHVCSVLLLFFSEGGTVYFQVYCYSNHTRSPLIAGHPQVTNSACLSFSGFSVSTNEESESV